MGYDVQTTVGLTSSPLFAVCSLEHKEAISPIEFRIPHDFSSDFHDCHQTLGLYTLSIDSLWYDSTNNISPNDALLRYTCRV